MSRQLVFQRRLPARFGRSPLWVSPAAALSYYRSLDSGNWQDLYDFAEYCVQPGDTVWDIGANVGVFSFAAAHCARAGGHVLAVEADSWLVQLIRRSARIPQHGATPVEVLCVAAAEGIGLQTFDVPRLTRSCAHLTTFQGAGDDIVGSTYETYPVVTISLDWLLAHRPPPAVLKIDVEGAECALLAGARTILGQHRPRILLEVFDRNADAVTSLLTQFGYELYDFTAGWAGRHHITRAAYNTLALPRSA
ncbi:MAG: FkbM family methyltransferase [Opitutaceae bacterium]|nr:FkbM family methyltransferase [Opitutaceae bacterium]